ncbi:P-loop containing nucleoside triphosphate hydrolase protein [Whalleya microplaca]|nr:P-loop containing nucleoside triphosphate hydrolase protein [Whalleya microplaca]
MTIKDHHDVVISREDDGLPWCHQLPRINPSTTFLFDSSAFNLENVIGAIQSGVSPEQIRECLAYYHEWDNQRFQDAINAKLKGFPAMFFIVEADKPELIRHWARYGGNPNATYGPDDFPLLAFAILRGAARRYQATDIVETLLRLEASPKVFPAGYYDPYVRELSNSGPKEINLHDIQDDNKLWCTSNIRPLLASALTLTQRYRLYQAARADHISARERIVLSRRGAEEVVGLHQLVIGQEVAVQLLKRRLLTHLAMPNKEPLVLLFAGPSGHGKTELARKFGDLMSLELLTIDCTNYTRENELFGPKPGYEGFQNGAPLNNFLARKSGNRCIVFMDELEKTTEAVHNALLVPFDEGEYMDRRNCSKVDCSKTIWILATNIFDDIIHEFCKTNRDKLSNSSVGFEHSSLMRRLIYRLRKECVTKFGAPLSGRITEIIPFITFSADEAAVVVDKAIMKMEAKVVRPVVVSSTKEGDNLVGNIELEVTRDATVCSKLANDYYEPQLGARSIFNGVDEVVVTSLVDQYLKDGDDLAEDQKMSFFKIGINGEDEVEVWRESKKD